MSKFDMAFLRPESGVEFRVYEQVTPREIIAMQARKLIHLIWNRGNSIVELVIDHQPISLHPQQIISLTYLQKFTSSNSDFPLTVFAFNREFYCIKDHDHEVSCNGIIFFGAQEMTIVTLSEEEADKFELLFQVFQDEFDTRDNIQGEMLQMLLKRFIIKITRLAKSQIMAHSLDLKQSETIRQFNFLVDENFREKKRVADYAEMLHKSPKTLSNLFANNHQQSPLQVIHDRIVLEAKRSLMYTDSSLKEIAFELGFEEVTHFSRLFKKITGTTPLAFRKSQQSG